VRRDTTDGCSTTDVARAAGNSPAAVSHHTKVLREAGLITTERDGYAVCHRITELGLSLLGPVVRASPNNAGSDHRTGWSGGDVRKMGTAPDA
jgi:DNA-binding transcriptional ArsR family regulator